MEAAPKEEIAQDEAEWPKVGWVFRKSPVVWYCWVLQREVVSMTGDHVEEAELQLQAYHLPSD